MKVFKIRPLISCLLLLALSSSSFSEQRIKSIDCKNDAFAAFKPLPELTYECPQDINNESDNRILKCPQRIQAINEVMRELRSFTYPDWWATAVDDLNVCELHGKAGKLSAEEQEQYTGPEYQVRLMGDSQIRVVLIPDPCYQTYYNGANAYLLYRKGAKVYVTQVLNGYYSRLGRSVSLKIYRKNMGEVIEIETENVSGMRPEKTSYYYEIDKVTNEAVRRKRIRKDNRR